MAVTQPGTDVPATHCVGEVHGRCIRGARGHGLDYPIHAALVAFMLAARYGGGVDRLPVYLCIETKAGDIRVKVALLWGVLGNQYRNVPGIPVANRARECLAQGIEPGVYRVRL